MDAADIYKGTRKIDLKKPRLERQLGCVPSVKQTIRTI